MKNNNPNERVAPLGSLRDWDRLLVLVYSAEKIPRILVTCLQHIEIIS